ncbi:MAG: N-acetyltransferase [Bacteroidales bacterium]|nr:N-acetyltransferase [Bacteroidales bacterium]
MTTMITYRHATINDAPFIAKGVMIALHTDPNAPVYQKLVEVCRKDDTLYSWKHALLATDGDQYAGLCLCYPGKNYHAMRLHTFALLEGFVDGMDLENAEDEAGEGEYYIDSLAVMESYRRQGIARQLILEQLEIGKQTGAKRATLLVDPDNPSAQKLYRQCGFTDDCQVYAFGQMFWKWQHLY